MGNEVSQPTPDDFQPEGAAYRRILELVRDKDSRKVFTTLRESDKSDARAISEILDKVISFNILVVRLEIDLLNAERADDGQHTKRYDSESKTSVTYFIRSR